MRTGEEKRTVSVKPGLSYSTVAAGIQQRIV